MNGRSPERSDCVHKTNLLTEGAPFVGILTRKRWDNNVGVFLHINLRTFLKQLEEHGRAHDAQELEHSRKLLNLEPDTAELVSILAQSSNAKCALETGTSNGYSTIWLAASIGPSGARVVSIERSLEK